jgi:hypothetical protein
MWWFSAFFWTMPNVFLIELISYLKRAGNLLIKKKKKSWKLSFALITALWSVFFQ